MAEQALVGRRSWSEIVLNWFHRLLEWYDGLGAIGIFLKLIAAFAFAVVLIFIIGYIGLAWHYFVPKGFIREIPQGFILVTIACLSVLIGQFLFRMSALQVFDPNDADFFGAIARFFGNPKIRPALLLLVASTWIYFAIEIGIFSQLEKSKQTSNWNHTEFVVDGEKLQLTQFGEAILEDISNHHEFPWRCFPTRFQDAFKRAFNGANKVQCLRDAEFHQTAEALSRNSLSVMEERSKIEDIIHIHETGAVKKSTIYMSLLGIMNNAPAMTANRVSFGRATIVRINGEHPDFSGRREVVFLAISHLIILMIALPNSWFGLKRPR